MHPLVTRVHLLLCLAGFSRTSILASSLLPFHLKALRMRLFDCNNSYDIMAIIGSINLRRVLSIFHSIAF